MKCAEVMEWMHRYLDHDLSQDEIIEMFRHIDNCPSCADVFDRLTLLSQELEQLPDVKPPFSLVDSILPQLDKLDQDIQQQSMVSEEDSGKVVPITRKSNRGKTASKGTSMAARTGIGAVAAAVILFIAVFNMPDSLPQAEVEQSLYQAAETSSDDAAMNKMATESEAAYEKGAENGAGNGAENSAGNNAADPEMQNAVPEVTAYAGNLDQNTARDAGPAEPSAAPTQRAEQAPAASEAPAVRSKVPPAAHKTAAPTAPAGAADTADEGQAGDSMSRIESSDTADNDAAKQEDSPPARSADMGIMSMLPAMVEEDSWSSPDGRYAAELAGQQLVIYALPASGIQEERTAVTSLPLEGTWVSGTWSEDGRQFTYVTLQDGAEISKVYTAPETAASPSASPQASASAEPEAMPTPGAGAGNK
ncbi:hypothetical protein C2I18_05000 [Paenibacillus sp. PK3_47]|uniref:anti-sigma factor family protein n=1 Tax=Paenibacillus sp. PK3_47 TaxID=2072642 RepID=UPI00201D8B73|nr:anti-sigma factor [Paenibacillus sp. PK3_47]UQZ32975.1 hypothetical protein C2I18_05000 [Paenibacillus sp. PK3_47]